VIRPLSAMLNIAKPFGVEAVERQRSRPSRFGYAAAFAFVGSSISFTASIFSIAPGSH
jgi:hypothetical protein